MRAQILWRKVHYWVSAGVALPILVVVTTGLLLQVKKDFAWIQPRENRGSGVPRVSFDAILAACAAIPEAKVTSWDDIQRLDLRPDRGLLKVTTSAGMEVQIDAADGRVMQVAVRRSDLIESLHDGSWFGGPVKRFVFLPAGILLAVMWGTGIYLFLLPQIKKRGVENAARGLTELHGLDHRASMAAMQPLKTYDYLVRARELVLAGVRRLSAEQYSQQFPIGLGTLGRTLTHIMICEWLYVERIMQRPVPPYEEWPIQDEKPPAFAALEAEWKRQAARTREAIGGVRDWMAEFEYRTKTDEGRPEIITVCAADIFTQLVQHEVHHRAQAINMLRQLGTAGMDVDFNTLMYKRRPG